MVIHKCPRCAKEFRLKGDYARHVNKKNPCSPNNTDKKVIIEDKILNNNTEIKNIECKYCNKKFSRQWSLIRHLDGRCKIKKQNETEKENIFKQLLMEMQELKLKIEKNDKENKDLRDQIIKVESKTNVKQNTIQTIKKDFKIKTNSDVFNDTVIKKVKFSENNQIFLSENSQEAIINKFPEKMRPFLENINNPLDETQVLVNLFKDKDVRIIIVNELDDFGDYEYVSYYHARDIAKNINYSSTDINHWAERWNVKFISYGNLDRQFGGPNLGSEISEKKNISNIINVKRTDKDANFISEQELKKVLLKVNTPEAKVFQEWILRQATISKKIFKYIIQIKHQQELDKKNREVNDLKYQLKTNKISEHVLKEATINAVKLFPSSKRDSGLIYIATSPDYQKKYTYKIGYTKTSAKQRETGLQCGNPDINIVYTVQVFDVELTEKFIHEYLKHLNYDKEFFYISSLEKAKSIVNEVSFFVNSFVQRHDNENINLQKKYIEDIKKAGRMLTTERKIIRN